VIRGQPSLSVFIGALSVANKHLNKARYVLGSILEKCSGETPKPH